MRSIKARFLKAKIGNRHVSSFIHFAGAVKGQKFSRKQISLAFNELVDKSDYMIDDRKMIIDYLVDITNRAEDGEFSMFFNS